MKATCITIISLLLLTLVTGRVIAYLLRRASFVSPPGRKYSNEPLNEPPDAVETLLLAALRENPSLSKEKLAQLTKRSRATITRAVQSLIQSGKIKRVGSKKTGHWELLSPNP